MMKKTCQAMKHKKIYNGRSTELLVMELLIKIDTIHTSNESSNRSASSIFVSSVVN